MKNIKNRTFFILLGLIVLLAPISIFAEEPEYTEVTKFSGSGDKTTESFSVDSDKWRVNWSIVPANDYAGFYLHVYKEGSSFPIESITSGETNSDTSVIREGPGSFYIEVASANLSSWQVVVEKAPPSKKSTEKSSSSSSDDSSCFIATAAYGTPFTEDIDVLRDFRDDVLKESPRGQAFVDWYYENGPAAAEFIKDRPMLRFVLCENYSLSHSLAY